MSETDLGPTDEKDWRRLKGGRNRGADHRDIPLHHLRHCQVTTSRWLQHTAPQSLEQDQNEAGLCSPALSQTKIYGIGKKKKAVCISANLCVMQFV